MENKIQMTKNTRIVDKYVGKNDTEDCYNDFKGGIKLLNQIPNKDVCHKKVAEDLIKFIDAENYKENFSFMENATKVFVRTYNDWYMSGDKKNEEEWETRFFEILYMNNIFKIASFEEFGLKHICVEILDITTNNILQLNNLYFEFLDTSNVYFDFHISGKDEMHKYSNKDRFRLIQKGN